MWPTWVAKRKNSPTAKRMINTTKLCDMNATKQPVAPTAVATPSNYSQEPNRDQLECIQLELIWIIFTGNMCAKEYHASILNITIYAREQWIIIVNSELVMNKSQKTIAHVKGTYLERVPKAWSYVVQETTATIRPYNTCQYCHPSKYLICISLLNHQVLHNIRNTKRIYSSRLNEHENKARIYSRCYLSPSPSCIVVSRNLPYWRLLDLPLGPNTNMHPAQSYKQYNLQDTINHFRMNVHDCV